MRRQGDSEEDRSSEEEAHSSDSEEDLDSPARIFQASSSSPAQPAKDDDASKDAAERMDTSESMLSPDTTPIQSKNSIAKESFVLDFANFDNFPVAMDTSASGGDAWAKFDDIMTKAPTSASEANENWADFSSFDDIANSPAGAKTDSEPVAMDTAEATQSSPSSRMAQYSECCASHHRRFLLPHI